MARRWQTPSHDCCLLASSCCLLTASVRQISPTMHKPELLDQLLCESTVYFRVRITSGGVEVFFSNQFAQMRAQS